MAAAAARARAAQRSRIAGGTALPEQDRRQLWLAAIKPPMYSVGIVPILVRARISNTSHPFLTSAISCISDTNPGLEILKMI